MPMAEKIIVTQDEEYAPGYKIAQQVERFLDRLKLDTYNNIYVVRIVVDKVEAELPEPEEDE